VVLGGGREVEVPGLYAVRVGRCLRRGYALVVSDIALTPQGLAGYVAKLEGAGGRRRVGAARSARGQHNG
jgi:hypothetical protein